MIAPVATHSYRKSHFVSPLMLTNFANNLSIHGCKGCAFLQLLKMCGTYSQSCQCFSFLPKPTAHMYTQTHRSYIFYFLINHWFSNGIETITVARSTAEVQEWEETKPLVPFFHSLESADIRKNQTVHVRMNVVTKHFALQNFQHRLMTYS